MVLVGEEIRLTGAPICSGVAIGTAFPYIRPESRVLEFSLEQSAVEDEVAYYKKALDESRQEVTILSDEMRNEGAVEGAQILCAHLQMLSDPALTTQIEEKIREEKKNSAFLLHQVVKGYEAQFEKIDDAFFRERVKDLKDVAYRVLSRLKQSRTPLLHTAPPDAVVFAEELVPSETAEVRADRIGAFVTMTGGETSHTAIMAKARGIPYVANVDYSQVHDLSTASVIVDGRSGTVFINPSETTLSKYRELVKELALYDLRYDEIGQYPAETIDGYRVGLFANVEMYHELELLHKYGSNGIGLFRSEYLCLSRDVFPSEEEQYEIYRRIVTAMDGQPVTIRTFDVGGDKFTEMPKMAGEVNPFLGCRAIRLMLREHEAFKAQLRAILRASAHGEVKILFPMVSGLAELREAKGYVALAKEELTKEGVPFAADVKIGCMIEVPSAAITCDLLTGECDFISIGTNDLVQYSLAVDRSNQAMNYLYTPADPSVIRLLRLIVKEANRGGIPVTICGEIAADPRFIPLLIGLGVNGLSVASRYLPIVKNAIRSTTIVSACDLAEKVLGLHTSLEVLDTLIDHHQQSVRERSD